MIDRERLIRWYDWQAPFYSLWRNRYDDPLLERIAEHAGATEGLVLDAACGSGFATLGLATRLERPRIVGIDRSTGMLRVARRERRRLSVEGVVLAAGDVTALPLADASVDVVVAAGLIPLLDDPGAALREFRRVTVDGGRLVSAEFDRERLTGLAWAQFRGMMAGHAMLARIFPSIRYAERWDVERSTIDPARYEAELEGAGWRVECAERAHRHHLYVARPR